MAPGKVVLVTGCSVGGIGWHLCAALAAQGATVFATARRPEATAGLTELGCRTLQLDVTDSASIGAAVAEVLREAGRIDVLVNNAGIAIRKPLVDFTIDEARHLMDTNYFGCVAMCAAVVPGMMERRQGTIFNVGSGLGYSPLPMMAHYSATKHALRAYTDIQRVELAPFGIAVCYVAPGYVRTNIGDENHDLPADSPYRCGAFPKLEAAMASSVFLGTSYEAATPVETFCTRLAVGVLSKSPPAHWKDGSLWFIPWLMSMFVPLWLQDLGFAIEFGLWPGCAAKQGRRAPSSRASRPLAACADS